MQRAVLLLLATVGGVQCALTHRYLFKPGAALADSVGGVDLVLGQSSGLDLHNNDGPNSDHQNAANFPGGEAFEQAILPTLNLTNEYSAGWSMCYWYFRDSPGATFVAAWDPVYDPSTDAPSDIRAHAYYGHQFQQPQLHNSYTSDSICNNKPNTPEGCPAEWKHFCVTYDTPGTVKPAFYENGAALPQVNGRSNVFSVMNSDCLEDPCPSPIADNSLTAPDPVRITPAIGHQTWWAYRWNPAPLDGSAPPITEARFADGYMKFADVKIYSHVLSAEEVVTAMTEPPPTGAVANPQVPFYGYGAIVADPNPAIVGEDTSIDVKVKNAGLADAEEVEVTLSFHDWGVSWGGWQEIATQTVAMIGAGAEAVLNYNYVFENRAHTCLEAKITAWGESDNSGGNIVLSDDRGQINMEVVLCDLSYADVCDLDIPFSNDGEKDIQVKDISVACLPGDSMDLVGDMAPCPMNPETKEPMVDLAFNEGDTTAEGVMVLGAGSEVSVKLNSKVAEENVKVVVQGVDSATGEMNHVLVSLVQTTVEAVLNSPLLCCITSIKTRVLLESMLADALDAYEAGASPSVLLHTSSALSGECRRAVQILRMFIQKAILIECDVDLGEKGCLEAAIRKITDAARMIAKNCGTALRYELETEEAQVPTRRNGGGLSKADAKRALDSLATGDLFRRAGLAEAAALEYSRATEKGWVRVSKKTGEIIA